MPNDQSLIQRQEELEMEMRALGTARFEKMIADARAGRRETETPYGSVLLEKCVLPLAAKIKEWLKAQVARSGSSVHTAVPFLSVINNHELAAYQTAKSLLDGIGQKKVLIAMAIRIASSLEDEVRMREFEGKNKAYYLTLKRSLDKRSDHGGYRKRVLVFCMNKAGIQWLGWSKADKVHLGMKLIDLFVESTGMIFLDRQFSGGKENPYAVVATPSLTEWINKKNASGSILQPELLPMLTPPKDWTSPWSGGYLTKAVPRMSLVKTQDTVYLEDLMNTEMPAVYKAINGLQATAWQVNAEVLMVFQELWGSGMEIGDTPSKALAEEPGKPLDIDTNPEAKKVWKRKVNEVKTANIQRTSRIIQTSKIEAIAVKFKDEPAIYFPYQMDFRGRVYPVPMFLNPQGPDHAKALLRFAEGKALGNQEAVDWLAIHGANTYGVDKVSYDERVKWVQENEKNIIECAENPLDYLWWTKADSPWQFLAFCFEWYGFTLSGFEHESKIPIALDGSCNGLQHFSAMLRDEVGGAAVNLVPADKPADIYQRVADLVNEEIKDDHSPLAKAWKSIGVTRKVTKRCVMTLPYGATEYAFKQFIQEFIVESGKELEFGDDFRNFKASGWLAQKIHAAIGKTVVKGMEAMTWLQELSKLACAEGLPLQWKTPAGFPVVQKYQKFKSKRIKISITGRVVQLNCYEALPDIDKKRQSNGVSPNFVHSLDAAALMLTVNAALDQQIGAFAMIHDSYGTHAADTQVLAETLRASFVALYDGGDVLKEFRESILKNNNVDQKTLPTAPEFGHLEIHDVFRSKYFFA